MAREDARLQTCCSVSPCGGVVVVVVVVVVVGGGGTR
jgi:hypothetical protein